MSDSIRRAGFGTLLALFMLGGGWASGAAADDELRVEVTGGALFDLGELAPGATGVTTATATNRTGDDARLAVRAVDVVDDDNGCNAPETEAGDQTCGIDGGELSRDLLISVAARGEPRFEGSLRDLSAGLVDLGALAAGETVELRFGYEFDAASGNDTQTDHVGFDVEVVLAQDLGSEVAGVQLQNDRLQPQHGSAAVVTRVAGAALARTGAGSDGLLRAGMAVAAVGGGLVLVTERRRHRPVAG